MLLQLLLYTFISFVCFWSGCVFYGFIFRLKGAVYDIPLINYLISGLIICTGFAQCAVLLMPLNEMATGIYLVLLILFSFLLRTELRPQLSTIKSKILSPELRPTLLAMIPFLLMILVLNAGPVIMDDTDSYHIQMVKWINTYGTVPGIANLHIRFGLNSSWFVAAGFYLPDTGSATSLALNGTISLWLGTFLIVKIMAMFQGGIADRPMNTGIAAIFILLLALLDWPLLRGNAASLNYDFITTAVLLILFFQLLQGKLMNAELFIWPCFLFTVRIINYPLLLLSGIALVICWTGKRQKQCWWLLIAGCLLILPFLLRNIYLSGHPFFPLQFPHHGLGDWKADPAVMSQYVEYTRAFNRVNEQHQPIDKTLELSFPEWTGYWYRYLFTIDKVIVTLALIAILVITIRYKRLKKVVPPPAQWLLAVSLIQLISWFIVSPDPRFAYGPLLIFIGVGLFLMLPAINSHQLRNGIKLAVVLLLGLIMVYTVRKIMLHPENRNWISPLNLPVPPVEPHTISGINFYIPLKIEGNWNARCYNTTLPCLYTIHPGLRPRGKDIREGFTIQQPRER